MGVRTTAIDIARDRHNHLNREQRIKMLEDEVALWAEARRLSDSVCDRLRKVACG